MKLRYGFVSNSSSQSFLIWGIQVDDLKELPAFASETEDDDDEYGDRYDEADRVLAKLGLEMHSPDCSGYYIGASWAKVKDNETGAQFKERVKALIAKATGLANPKCSTHEEAWRDG